MEEDAGPSDQALLQQVQARSSEVTGLLRTGNKTAALRAAIDCPPVATKTQSIKDTNFETVSRVFGAMSESEITAAIEELTFEECDVMMKYVYKALSKPAETNCAFMLKTHAVLVEKAGLGSIVRVMVDRKTV